MLNACHMLLVYPALLSGYRLVHEAMADTTMVDLLRQFLQLDAIPHLQGPVGVSLDDYADAVLDRFANPAVGDQLLRIAGDGAAKLPTFHARTIRILLDRQRDVRREALLVAGFRKYTRGIDDLGHSYDVDINTRGLFFTLQATARTMIRRRIEGSIINIASQAGRRGEAPSSIYAATKAAVISLTQSAALALIDDGIRVNAVAPGVVDTAMWKRIDAIRSAEHGDPAGTFTAAVTETIPAKRLGRPAEIAQTVVFLASASSSYLVGQTINVDGGNVLS